MSLSQVLKRHETGLLLAILVAIALTAALDKQHSYLSDPKGIAVDLIRQTSLLGIFSLGAAVVIIAGGIDLSSGAVIAFSGALCGSLLLWMAPQRMAANEPVGIGVISVAIAGTFLAALAIGCLHAWLITTVRLPPFVATLATLVGLRSAGRILVQEVTQRLQSSASSQIHIYDEQFRFLATSVWIPACLFLVLAVAIWVMLRWTVTGRHLYALGGNEQAARLSGIRTDRLKYLAYSLSAVLSAVAGVLYIADTAEADPYTLGRGYELNAIAAAVVGGCSLQGGSGTIPGTVLGALFLRVVVDGVSKIIKSNADTYEGLIVGLVVVLAVAFTQWRSWGRGPRAH